MAATFSRSPGGARKCAIGSVRLSHAVIRTVRAHFFLLRPKYNVPLFINDRLDIALLLSCHLHVGQSDLPYPLARQLLGPDRLLGVSVNTSAEMREILSPERKGMVDYVGIGPCFGTQTKKNLNPIVGPRGVRDVLQVLGDSEIKAVVIGACLASAPGSGTSRA